MEDGEAVGLVKRLVMLAPRESKKSKVVELVKRVFRSKGASGYANKNHFNVLNPRLYLSPHA